MHRIAAVFGAVLAILTAATAHAAPDPHIPDPKNDYCPGGGAGSMIYLGYCDGTKYPDGSYWHWFQNGVPLIGKPSGLGGSPGLVCVVDNGSPVPPLAPPGGCGGGWNGQPTEPNMPAVPGQP